MQIAAVFLGGGGPGVWTVSPFFYDSYRDIVLLRNLRYYEYVIRGLSNGITMWRAKSYGLCLIWLVF